MWASDPRFVAAGAMALLAGCLPREPEGEIARPNLASVQSLIFTAKCALPDCHGGAEPKQGMSLEPGKAVPLVVGVRAVEAPLYRVKPTDPDASYLVAKIEGRQKDVGGSGKQMPADGTPLTGPEVKLVRDWIAAMVPEVRPPKVASLLPAAGAVGDAVVIGGSDFGDAQGDGTVAFGAVPATDVHAWSFAQIEVAVPAGLSPGSVPVVVTAGGKSSNAAAFDVRSEKLPTIIAALPDTGAVGATVTVRGSNLGASQGASTVTFAGTGAGAAVSWSDTQVQVKVPTGATSGPVVVTVSGQASNGVAFFVVKPTLSSIQAAVFSRRCGVVNCHNSPSGPPDITKDCPAGATTNGQDLTDGRTYASVVGVDSCEMPGTPRVQPGSRVGSYLMTKISSATPPRGDRMPLNATPLPQSVIDTIGTWIDQGAQNN